MEELNWLRRTYRARLARYAWGRWLKRVYLVLRLALIQSRHWLVWHSLHGLHVAQLAVAQRLATMSGSTRRRMRLTKTELASQLVPGGRLGNAPNAGAPGMQRMLALASVDGAPGCASDPDPARTSSGAAAVRIQSLALRGILPFLSALAFILDRLCQRVSGQKIAFFSMSSLEEYRRATAAPAAVLVPERIPIIATPTVYPAEARDCLHSGTWPVPVPQLDVVELSDAQVLGRSDLVFVGSECLHHGLYDFERDQLFEEIHGVVSIRADKGILARFGGASVQGLPAGISLVGSATSNYVHWLTETAPKLALLDRLDGLADVPYIIDAGLHPNILDSIRLLNTRGRPLVTLGRGELLPVEKLFAVSPVAYIPFDFRPGLTFEKRDIHPGFAMYSPDALQLLRQRLVERVGASSSARRKRLFVRRGAKSRLMTNAAEVEGLVRELGFEIVAPETMSFAEQVRLFSQAEVVVGQGGAAFGNILFAPPGCHVVILSTWSPYTIYYYFSNIASLLGQRCSFILCDPVQDADGYHRAHMGLQVPLHTLRQAIEP